MMAAAAGFISFLIQLLFLLLLLLLMNSSHDDGCSFQVPGQQLKSYWMLVPTLIGEQFGHKPLRMMMAKMLTMMLPQHY